MNFDESHSVVGTQIFMYTAHSTKKKDNGTIT